jgi:hypothetical protein
VRRLDEGYPPSPAVLVEFILAPKLLGIGEILGENQVSFRVVA